MADLTAEHGLVWCTHVPVYGHIVVSIRPDDVKHILTDNFDNYVKGPMVHDALYDLLGDGIFTVDGAEWKVQRQASAHLFKKRLMHEAVRTFLDHADDVEAFLDDHIKSNEAFDVQQMFSAFTMDSFIEICFGKKLSTVRGDKIPFAQAFDDTTAALMFRLAFPLWSYLPKTFKLRRDLRTIRAFVHDVIGERRAEVARAGSVGTREDVLSRFMSLGHATDQQLHDAAVNFILAGRDTTAQLLTWTFYLLATHRDTQTKLLHHIDTLVGDKPLTMDNLKHMDYLQAVMDETLRLYPPVPIDFKKSIAADRLPSGVDVPADTYTMWSAWIMGRSPVLWDDPDTFRPERWLDPAHPVPPHHAVPFQQGPRICLGKNFAYLEVKTLICRILPLFEFAPSPTHAPPRVANGVTLRASHGVHLIVKRRQ
eukprot:CAMPEP_0168606304 /NCGR_PEP_ID=MMETSP0420-20121227/16494_1 /TAXON_ID=498008 /ORGANISM="Pessonella sp." /LENGTH=423 /DNA_ID=CAMNT_0008645949 /DNA_START=131 /DNA_END=1402 /DNA_ORIENTATION=+